MFLSKILRRRRQGVVQRIEEYTKPPSPPFALVGCAECGGQDSHTGYCSQSAMRTGVLYPLKPQSITIDVPLTVDGALLATQIEHQLKRRGLH